LTIPELDPAQLGSRPTISSISSSAPFWDSIQPFWSVKVTGLVIGAGYVGPVAVISALTVSGPVEAMSDAVKVSGRPWWCPNRRS
jgi:hypothetical protein